MDMIEGTEGDWRPSQSLFTWTEKRASAGSAVQQGPGADAVAELPGMGGLKFRKKRENNVPKGLKDKMSRKPLSHYVSGQSESTEKVSLHHSFCSSLPPASAADRDRIWGQMELSSIRSGRSLSSV